jgi:glycosyltransferase involved in cell wall biosynthesis
MKICIPFKPSDVGGTSIFMRKFVEGLMKRGVEVTTNIDDKYELLFVIISHDGFFNKKLQEKKREGIKIVQRLDGVLTFATSNFFYPLKNFGMKYVHNKLADYIIFQSEYSKFLCDKYLGKPCCDWSIIYNGVDIGKFSPMGDGFEYGAKRSLFTASRFRRSQQIIPMIKAVDILIKEIENLEFVIAGPVEPKLMSFIPKDSKYVRYLGKIKNEDLPFYERLADVFIFSTLNPPCPNAVIEAISCGLPVAGYNTGAMPELVGNEAGLLAEHKSNDLYRFSKANPEKLADVTLKILEDDERYKKQARERAVKLFSLDKMVNEYVKVFEKVLEGD